jgi:Fur family peroxide stress response transcriptional regulator
MATQRRHKPRSGLSRSTLEHSPVSGESPNSHTQSGTRVRGKAELAAMLQRAGLRVTGPRLTIFQALINDPTHPTAEALYHRLRPDNVNLSLSTIYKTMEAFVRAGLCQRLFGCGPQMRVDPNCQHHWHAVCDECGHVEDFEPPAYMKLEPPARAGSMVIRAIQVQLNGICAECNQSRLARRGQASS